MLADKCGDIVELPRRDKSASYRRVEVAATEKAFRDRRSRSLYGEGFIDPRSVSTATNCTVRFWRPLAGCLRSGAGGMGVELGTDRGPTPRQAPA